MSQPAPTTISANTQLTSQPNQPLHGAQPKPSLNGRAPTNRSPPKVKPPQPQPKKLTGRSSKPIINWFQRKLAGTVKTNRRLPAGGPDLEPRVENTTMRGQNRVGPTGSKPIPRVASSPFPHPTLLTPPRHGKTDSGPSAARRKTISLNADDDGQSPSVLSYEGDDMDQLTNRSSLARESTWSPTSNLEADEDASVRPLPPSGPPSPSPSLSASSYLSDPHTFRSMAASTKPTTLLSIDLPPHGVAHIAQAPSTPLMAGPRFPPHIRTSSGGAPGGLIGSGASITFSALPPQSSSRPSSLNAPAVLMSINGQPSSVQAPLHTAHHPRNNPRPSSPPMDNASMLTLASSAYAMSGTRMGFNMPGWAPGTPSAMADSISHFGFGGSINGDAEGDMSSQYVLGDDDRLDVYGERDVDASVRALRPRSSRRGSWDSEHSDWSAPVGNAGAGRSTGTPSRSLWTTNSIRTGAHLSMDNDGQNEKSEGSGSADERSLEQQTPSRPTEPLPVEDPPQLPVNSVSNGTQSTPKRKADDESTLQEPIELPVKEVRLESPEDGRSLAETQTDVWHSAPTTPML